MHRRRLLQSFAAAVLARPVVGLAARSEQAPAAPFSEAEVETLRALAEIVLPGAVGAAGRERVVTRFVAWHRSYREGADRGHSYGSSTLASPSGPAPAARYPPQFAALDAAARERGAARFAALAPEVGRAIVEATLDVPPRVTRLPARPTGANLVADIMGFYFNSGDAWDLCYDAEIGRDRCRALDGSDQPPPRFGFRG